MIVKNLHVSEYRRVPRERGRCIRGSTGAAYVDRRAARKTSKTSPDMWIISRSHISSLPTIAAVGLEVARRSDGPRAKGYAVAVQSLIRVIMLSVAENSAGRFPCRPCQRASTRHVRPPVRSVNTSGVRAVMTRVRVCINYIVIT